MVRITEALEVDNLPFAQKLDRIAHIRVIHQAQDVVIGHPSLLFRSEVLGQVADDVAGRLQGACRKRHARSRLRVDAGGVVHKICFQAALLDLVDAQTLGQLVQDGADNLDVGQLLGADVSQPRLHLAPGRRITLAEVARRRAQLSIGSSQLQQDMKFAGPSYFLLPPFVI